MSGSPQVSVVLPTRNRSAMLRQSLGSALGQTGVELEAIVVDEGSSDDTAEVARDAGAAAVHLPLNRGQGAALRTGYRLALATGARLVVTMDADGQHEPSELPRLVQPIVDGRADVVNGSRVLGAADPNQ